jgi:hypothetical protein
MNRRDPESRRTIPLDVPKLDAVSLHTWIPLANRCHREPHGSVKKTASSSVSATTGRSAGAVRRTTASSRRPTPLRRACGAVATCSNSTSAVPAVTV